MRSPLPVIVADGLRPSSLFGRKSPEWQVSRPISNTVPHIPTPEKCQQNVEHRVGDSPSLDSAGSSPRNRCLKNNILGDRYDKRGGYRRTRGKAKQPPNSRQQSYFLLFHDYCGYGRMAMGAARPRG
jgi:hypothetical protein